VLDERVAEQLKLPFAELQVAGSIELPGERRGAKTVFGITSFVVSTTVVHRREPFHVTVFRAGARPRPTEVSRYIDEHRGRFGVGPICRTLGVSVSAY
jgi:hypothetical protein